MNKGMLTVGIILLSIIALILINVLTNYSTGSELDYYLVKETTDAAIEDSIDVYYLRTCGVYRLDKEKFVESFLYRFADSVDNTRSYKIGFYDINEVPPKVSVKVDSLTAIAFTTKDNTGKDKDISGNISTSYDAILETKYLTNLAVEEGLQDKNQEACKAVRES
jgi:hypothetical protein